MGNGIRFGRGMCERYINQSKCTKTSQKSRPLCTKLIKVKKLKKTYRKLLTIASPFAIIWVSSERGTKKYIKRQDLEMKNLFKKNTKNNVKIYAVRWVDIIVPNAGGQIASFTDETLAREYVEFKNNTEQDFYIDYYVAEIVK